MKNNQISLLEYEEYKNTRNIFTQKDFLELERINKNLNCKIFEIIAKGFKAKQFVGICQIGNKTIEVLPKIFVNKEKLKEANKEEQTKIRKNLLYMLSYTKKLKIKESDISSLSKNSTLYECIIYLFVKNLIELLKKDLVKNYETKEENTNFLKGKLLMTKHLRYNLFNKAKFYSQFDEFTEDNLLNRTFKATIDKLLKFTQNSKNFKLLTQCNLILQDVSLNMLSISDVEKVKFTRLNKRYENIFNLAKLLLFGNSIELNSKNIKTYSLMFDMNKLFEEFIFEFIRRECNYNNYLIRSELPRKYLFKESPKFELKPDITFYEENNCKLLIDTKYKKIENLKDISTTDVYQMLVYSQIYNCENIILLYPQYEKEFENEEFLLDKKENQTILDFKIKIRTINLHIDLIKNEDKEKLKEELDKILENNKND